MTGIQWYYQITCLLFIFLMAYTFIFSSKFAEDLCYGDIAKEVCPTTTTAIVDPDTTDTGDTTDTNTTARLNNPHRHLFNFNDTSHRFLATDAALNVTETSTSYTAIALVIAFVYIAEVGLCLICILFLYYFSNLDIAKFAKLGFCQRCGGKLSKCIPYLIVLGHYVLLIMIMAEIALVFFIGTCKKARHIDTATGDCSVGQMQKEAEAYVIVLIVMWICMHTCGGFMRRNVYYDSFFYQPEDKSKPCKNWTLVKCGP